MNIPNVPVPILYGLFIWSLLWKGLALWRAAKLNQRNWFVAMLVVNSVGIMELVYLFVFAKQRMKLQELLFWKNTKTKA